MIERTNGWDWGDVPTWVASFAGLAALIVASYAAAKTRAMLKIESNRDEAAKEREERAQADLVAAWLHKEPNQHWRVVIANANRLPVYSLRLIVIFGYHSDTNNNTIEHSIPVLQPGERRIEITNVLPMLTSGLPDDEAMAKMVELNHDNDSVIRACSVWITFRDASGVRWTRADDGILDYDFLGPFAVDETPSVKE